jgi:polysaccharide export outer membrane protein
MSLKGDAPTTSFSAVAGPFDAKVGRRWLLAAALPCTTLPLAGCGLPTAAPTPRQLEQVSKDPDWNVYFVRVSGAVIKELGTYQPRGFPDSFRSLRYKPTGALNPGDIIGISIYESGGGPQLFSAAPSPMQLPGVGGTPPPPPATTIPSQTIEADGRINVPFAGRVRVAGKTQSEAAEAIAAVLGTQTAKPQVVVALIRSVASAVSVGGEVNQAGQVLLTLRGEKLLDVIAQAGGPKFPATDVDARIMRGTAVASLPLQQVISSAIDNVVMQPNDTVVLVRNPKTFVVLGASPKVSQYNFETERVSLAEAVARAGGAVETTGNMAGIYLFRNEPSGLARNVFQSDPNAVDRTYISANEERLLAEPETRVMYRFDLTQAGGFFLAQNMAVRDKDIILVSNAPVTEMQKFFQVIRGITGVYYDLSRPVTVQGQ